MAHVSPSYRVIMAGWFPVLLVTSVALSWFEGAVVDASSTLNGLVEGGDQTALVYPFFISEPPHTTFVRPSGNVSLRCSAGPSSDVSISWRYNNLTIPLHHKIVGLSLSGGQLAIRSFSPHQHAGIYHCVANNSLGSILSQPAKLIEAVLDGFENDSSTNGSRLSPHVLSVVEGNTVLIPCPQPRSSPPASIEFLFNQSPMEVTARYQVLPFRGLLIFGARKRIDQGLYTCVAVNTISQQRVTAGNSTNLIVNQAPSQNIAARLLSPSSTTVEVVRGKTLSLECIADGWPVPSVRWSRYGGHLPKDRYSQTLGILTIQNVDLLDEGTYICEASNDNAQSQRRTVFVNVLVAPVIVVPPRSRTAAVGATVSLHCGAEGVPGSYITWLHNALPVVAESFTTEEFKDNLIDSKLTLVNIDRQHSGIYQCVVNNSLGTSYATSLLTVGDSAILGSLQNIPLHASHVDRSTMRPTRRSTAGPRPLRQPTDGLRQKSGVDVLHNQRKNDRKTNRRNQGNKAPRRSALANATETAVFASLQDEPSKTSSLQPQRQAEQLNLAPPPKPTVTIVSETSVMLRWVIASRDVRFVKVQYKRLRNQQSNSRWETVDEDLSPTTQSFEVTKLQSGGKYCFRLVAVYSNNDNKHGLNSPHVHLKSVGRRPKAPTTAPFVVEVLPLSTRSISITWQYLPNEPVTIDGFIVQYRRYERESDDYIEQKIRNVKTRKTQLNNLDEDAIYSIRMLCYNERGRSDLSNTVVKKTLGVLNGQPQDVSNNLGSQSEHDIAPGKNVDPRTDFSPSTSKKPSLETIGASPPRVAARQENSTLYIILGVVCGAIVVGVVVVLFVCFRRQKQQRLLIAALRMRSKPPMPNKACNGKPNSVTPMLRQADSLVSSFPSIGLSYCPDGNTPGASRLGDAWSRQYMHDPPVYDYPSHLTDHRLSNYSQSHRSSVQLGVHHREQKQPLMNMMPEGNLFTRNMHYQSSTMDDLSQASSSLPTSLRSGSMPRQRTPRASHEYNTSEFLTFRGRSAAESDAATSYHQVIPDGRLDDNADDVDESCSSIIQQPVLTDHYEIIGYHLTETGENCSDRSDSEQSLPCAQDTRDKISLPESTV